MLKLNDLHLTLEKAPLSNGIKITHFYRPGAPVSVRLSFIAGSRYDAIPGIAHFLEHILVTGTNKYPTKDRLANVIENLGGNFKATTGIEALNINFNVARSGDINTISDLMGEMVINPLFSDKVIDFERKSILRELDDKQSNPIKKNADDFRNLFYKETTLNNPNIGTLDTIEKITKSDLQSFYHDFIINGQAVLTTCGDISLTAIQDEFEPVLQKITPTNHLAASNLVFLSPDRKVRIEQPGSNQVFFTYGFKTSPQIDKNQPALTVLSNLLGGSRSSLMMKVLRYEKGLVSGINCWNDALSDSGVWAIQTSTGNDKFSEVLSLIKNQIDEIKNNGVSEEDLTIVKNKIVNSGIITLQTSESVVNFHSFKQFLYPDQSWTVEDFTRDISNVTSEDIKNASREYFNDGYLAVFGNVDIDGISLQ